MSLNYGLLNTCAYRTTGGFMNRIFLCYLWLDKSPEDNSASLRGKEILIWDNQTVI